MKAIEQRLPQEFDKSFIVFRETGQYFPCPWHYHPEFELVLITSSTGRRMVGDHIGYFEKDDLVFMGPKLPHVWMNDSEYINGEADCFADGIVIQFVENFLGDKFLNIPEMAGLKKMLELSGRGMVIKGQTKEKINSLMKEMVNMNGLQRLSALFTIFDYLATTTEYELLASPGYVQKTTVQCSDRFNKVTEYIMRNFDSDITLPEVASVSNMAITTFCNFFKEHYRVTFIEYLNTVRVGYACKLLAEKNKNVVEAAYESGYKNLANFNRQFKKIKNMTPTEYRRTVNME
ncbi:AraC family transcriptional regulator [Flavisolibacter ginsenosidimutans]|uniref:Helix-turn-helix domain-containing protein n=1 Tax=Flavisolibacter ginsenosidimutans TaxID=661481 RepID=A0A5B8UDG9_9BACT|nr:AraC family transcriptional regulator [Flavisolibacter ginsenosidimutans]QEC54405.1 helix-turn-helix domain-containing protein [Flavisolibacter ginsenosidimutans]